VKYTTLKI